MRSQIRIFAVLLALVAPALGQVENITIPAGTPEDKDLTAITAEQDNQKKEAMYQDFLQMYAANPMAVAYGNWQLSQLYQNLGDLKKALEAADKASVAAPHNLDIVVSQATVAQQLKDNAAVFKYSIRGGEIYGSIDKQTKPAGVSDGQFASEIANQKEQNKAAYDFFQSAAFNTIATETNSKARMDEIDQFTAAFPKSSMDDQISSYALLSLSELKNTSRLLAFANKRLAANPDDLPTLVMLANTYADGTDSAKAIPYAQKAILVAKADAADADRARKISAGSAHCALGRVYANQGKTLPSIAELKSATSLLKGQDEQQYAVAAYYLGWNYAKLNKLTEARAILTETAAIPGPVQGPTKELLTKVNSARAAGH
jgi:tetratricopeptide (TPR) repeat protein